MDLKKMEYFESVSRLKNFTKAAEELHVAQPSITVSILKLEEELGVCLLHRDQRSVNLTKEGEIFLERVKKILNDVQNTVSEMYDLGSKANRELRLAIPTALGSWMFPIIFTEYASRYPHVILNIHELGVQNIIDRVSDETIELGLIVLSDPSPSYMTLPFYHGELLVVFPIDHPLSRYETVPFEILKNEKFILCARGSYIKKRIMEECEKCGFAPDILFTPLQVVTAFNMVASGAGITFVLDDTIAIIKNNPHIAIRPLAEPIQFQTGFIWAKDKYLSALALDFIKFMQKFKS
ncbi:LysR family transcriptional regulator [Pelosinus sp. UFO1]|uniref:LysR family transcriptional regulator n=1 Tax=Pelosinus sp. UFO1 TaxID=484770 RepID=UPI0004D10A5B|nr:LysR family transcriptional regulator [Pelosinus sp. UFO1]AIF51140.1 transcriptional regulator, LysR family [Pelosinus sp. UFO1]